MTVLQSLPYFTLASIVLININYVCTRPQFQLPIPGDLNNATGLTSSLTDPLTNTSQISNALGNTSALTSNLPAPLNNATGIISNLPLNTSNGEVFTGLVQQLQPQDVFSVVLALSSGSVPNITNTPVDLNQVNGIVSGLSSGDISNVAGMVTNATGGLTDNLPVDVGGITNVTGGLPLNVSNIGDINNMTGGLPLDVGNIGDVTNLTGGVGNISNITSLTGGLPLGGISNLPDVTNATGIIGGVTNTGALTNISQVNLTQVQFTELLTKLPIGSSNGNITKCATMDQAASTIDSTIATYTVTFIPVAGGVIVAVTKIPAQVVPSGATYLVENIGSVSNTTNGIQTVPSNVFNAASANNICF